MGKSKSPSPARQKSNYYGEELARNVTPRFNLGTQMVVTTRDKIENCLLKNERAMRAQRDWIAPLGICLSLVATLVSSSFHTALRISAAVWEAIFSVAVAGAGLWLLVAIVNVFRYWERASVSWLVAQLCADPVAEPPELTEGTASAAEPPVA